MKRWWTWLILAGWVVAQNTTDPITISGILPNGRFTEEIGLTDLTAPTVEGELIEVKGRDSIVAKDAIKVRPRGDKRFYLSVRVDKPGYYQGTLTFSEKDKLSQQRQVIVQAFQVTPDREKVRVVGGGEQVLNLSPNEGLFTSDQMGKFPVLAFSVRPLKHSAANQEGHVLNPCKVLELAQCNIKSSTSGNTTPPTSNTSTPPEQVKGDGGYSIKLNFKRPTGFTPGLYKGELLVQLKDQGDTLAKIPLEILLKPWSGWAILVLVLGLLLAIFFNWWSSSGHKNSQLWQRLRLTQSRLLRLNSASQAVLKAKLNEAEDFLRSGDSTAEAKLNAVITELEGLLARQFRVDDWVQKLGSWEGDIQSLYQSLAKNVPLASGDPFDSFLKGRLAYTLALKLRLKDLDLNRTDLTGEQNAVADVEKLVALLRQAQQLLPTQNDDWRKRLASVQDQSGLENHLNTVLGALVSQRTSPKDFKLPKPPWLENILRQFRVRIEQNGAVMSFLTISITVAVIAIVGFNELYAKKDNFGSDLPMDYLGLFLWGFGSYAGVNGVSQGFLKIVNWPIK